MNSPLFAVDTNFLMDLAFPRDVAHDALDLILERSPKAAVLVTERVLVELDRFATTPALGKQALALKAQAVMIERGIRPVLLADLQVPIAASIATKLIDQGILPWKERNDARILAEAAVLGCRLLITSDKHLRDADRTQLARVLRECGFSEVMVRKPAEIARLF